MRYIVIVLTCVISSVVHCHCCHLQSDLTLDYTLIHKQVDNVIICSVELDMFRIATHITAKFLLL